MPTSSSKKRRTNGPIKWVLAMRMLLSPRSIALKAPRGLSQKLRGHAEVALGSGHVDVAKVGRQQGEARLHINPLSVPGDDPVDGHGVPQVMEAGLPPIGRDRLREPNWRFTLCTARSMPPNNTKRLLLCCFAVTEHL